MGVLDVVCHMGARAPRGLPNRRGAPGALR